MAGAPEGRGDQGDLVAQHGARLHHLAAMLTGATDGATRLTAQTLAAAGPGAGWRELRGALVRAYLRTAPRRPERMPPGGAQDAGDVLDRLRPRERAVAALRLVEGASTADTAEALRLPAEKVERLLPTTPGLGTALQAVGDRYALQGSALAAALEPALAQAPPEPTGRDRRWWWVAAAAVLVAVLVGYAFSPDREASSGLDEEGPTGAESVDVRSVDLDEAGFELDEDGEPPRGAAGLTRMETLELTPGRSADLTLNTVDARFGGQVASFAVLWCDMPPTDDPALERPVGEISVEGSTLTLPCAGTAGEPAVGLDHVVALPASAEAQVRVTGDLPPDGGAVLGVYAQTDDMAVEPLPDGDLTAGPPVPEDAVVVDQPGSPLPYGPGQRLAQPVELSPGSTVRVWAGRTGAVSVLVDGIPVTDDGDLARWAGGRADWRDQQLDVRDGRWMVYVPGSAREFTIPDDVVPPNGRRPAVVEVVTESTEHVQVVATQAVPGDADREPVPQSDGGEAPELVAGHRLAAAWELPMDGLQRELLDPPEDSDLSWALLPTDPSTLTGRLALFGQGGTLQFDGQSLPLRSATDPSDVSRIIAESQLWDDRWTQQPDLAGPGGEPWEPDGLQATAPAAPGRPPGVLLAYEPVPYEEFDFAAATAPATSWSVGEEPPRSQFGSAPPLATVTEDDLDEDGRTTVEVPTGVLGARIETEGRGRIRFQVDDEPVELLGGTDGWWSSWTDRSVVSQTPLSYGAYSITGDLELTITVEDYDDVRIELLRS
ncbi:hypothetical protein [uncultured Serinicoccus sp.]|uniref:hypothetical protein n=1 Tax=uncultured Serinicoccus sp. TaxID=735514 RepID=UPI002638CD3E|nr:hypothetical protein [uncultured Serinicoccus sp.]